MSGNETLQRIILALDNMKKRPLHILKVKWEKAKVFSMLFTILLIVAEQELLQLCGDLMGR